MTSTVSKSNKDKIFDDVDDEYLPTRNAKTVDRAASTAANNDRDYFGDGKSRNNDRDQSPRDTRSERERPRYAKNERDYRHRDERDDRRRDERDDRQRDDRDHRHRDNRGDDRQKDDRDHRYRDDRDSRYRDDRRRDEREREHRHRDRDDRDERRDSRNEVVEARTTSRRNERPRWEMSPPSRVAEREQAAAAASSASQEPAVKRTKTDTEDAYAELFPSTDAYFGGGDDSDEEDYSQMDTVCRRRHRHRRRLGSNRVDYGRLVFRVRAKALSNAAISSRKTISRITRAAGRRSRKPSFNMASKQPPAIEKLADSMWPLKSESSIGNTTRSRRLSTDVALEARAKHELKFNKLNYFFSAAQSVVYTNCTFHCQIKVFFI